MSALRLLKCVGEAVRHHWPLALARMLPMGESLYEVARHAYKAYREAGELKADVEAVAAATPAEIEAEVAAVVADAPADQREQLATYLALVPDAIRRSLRRPDDPSGKTVPSDRAIGSPEALAAMLPDRLPRFRPGDRPAFDPSLALVRMLGVGGFGEVWLARPDDPPGGPDVVLKFCKDAAAAVAIRHEAGLVERLMRAGRHPGIVPLRRAWLDADPPCLEFEYVPGGDLGGLVQDYAAGGKLTPQTAAAWVLALARILGFAHRLRPAVVHRDLKPSNVLVRRDDAGRADLRLTDFGIGGLAAAGENGTRVADLATALRGSCTPLYASPQQRAGSPPDPRDDVHALGVIWYQLLTGDLTAGRPSGRGWRRQLAEKGVPAEWLELLESCIDDLPEERPADAAELAGRFDPALVPALEPAEAAPAVSALELARLLDDARDDWLLNLARLREVYTPRGVRAVPGRRDASGTLVPWPFKAEPAWPGEHARIHGFQFGRHEAVLNLRVAEPVRLVETAAGRPVTEAAGFLLDRLVQFRSYTVADSGELNLPALAVRVVRARLFDRLKQLGVLPASAAFDPRADLTLRLDRLPLVGQPGDAGPLVPLFEELAALKVLASVVRAHKPPGGDDLTPEQEAELKRLGVSGDLRFSPPTVPPYGDRKAALAAGEIGVRTSWRVDVGTTNILNLDKFRPANEFLQRYYEVKSVTKPTWADVLAGGAVRAKTVTGRTKPTPADAVARPLVDDFLGLAKTGAAAAVLERAGADALARLVRDRDPAAPPPAGYAEALRDALGKLEGRAEAAYRERLSPLVFYVGTTGHLPAALGAAEPLRAAELGERYPALTFAAEEREGTFYAVGDAVVGVWPRAVDFSKD